MTKTQGMLIMINWVLFNFIHYVAYHKTHIVENVYYDTVLFEKIGITIILCLLTISSLGGFVLLYLIMYGIIVGTK